MARRTFSKLFASCCLLVPGACTKPDPTPTAAPSAKTPVTAPPEAPAKPVAATPSAAPSATAREGDESCFSPEKSQEYAKPHKNAAPPYEECAAGIFSHCEPDHAYCSIAFDVARTKKKRASGTKLCCYGR